MDKYAQPLYSPSKNGIIGASSNSMVPKILETLHQLIEENPKAQILKVTPAQAQEYFNFLMEFSLNKPSDQALARSKMVYLGRRLEEYEPNNL